MDNPVKNDLGWVSALTVLCCKNRICTILSQGQSKVHPLAPISKGALTRYSLIAELRIIVIHVRKRMLHGTL